MTEQERLGQIEWFEDLKEAIEAGDIEDAIASIDGALKLLTAPGAAAIREK